MGGIVKRLRHWCSEDPGQAKVWNIAKLQQLVTDVLAENDRLRVVAQEWEEKSNNSVEWAMSAGQKNVRLRKDQSRLMFLCWKHQICPDCGGRCEINQDLGRLCCTDCKSMGPPA